MRGTIRRALLGSFLFEAVSKHTIDFLGLEFGDARED
jgi:hypothetical protein